jgi:hypothetical protein
MDISAALSRHQIGGQLALTICAAFQVQLFELHERTAMKPKLLFNLAVLSVITALLALAPIASPVVAQSIAPETAASARTAPYSGQLSDDLGQPVADGLYTFSFALYDVAQGGKQLWSETQPGVAVQSGAFMVLLGRVTSLPEKARLKDGWLAVGVRGPEEAEFTALEPRQQIDTSTPAAPSSPTASAACAHTHFAEYWEGDATGAYPDNAGLYINNTASYGHGIEGENNSDAHSYGVVGKSDSGTGVFGHSVSGFSMVADNNTWQSRSSGGWIKAMAYVSGTTIDHCYNSYLLPINTVKTPPCGFTSTGSGGVYTVDFGFQVNDRFITITPHYGGAAPSAAVASFPTANSVTVKLSADAAFFIIVY